MLPKELLIARKSKGRIYPRYAELKQEQGWAQRVIDCFHSSVGTRRRELFEQLERLETHKQFRLVRGLAHLVERRCTWAVGRTVNEPLAIRKHLFEAGFVATEQERQAVLAQVASQLQATAAQLDAAFWADRDEEQILTAVPAVDPVELLREYNTELTQTLLLDALSLRFHVTGNYQSVFRLIKLCGLMYELCDDGWVEVSGPASLVSQATRYGAGFAQLFPELIECSNWTVRAQIQVATWQRQKQTCLFELSDAHRDLFQIVPMDRANLAPEAFDSGVEADFARRISHLMPNWEVVREPEWIKAGRHAFIPDFVLQLRRDPAVKHYVEIVGFWTPEYLERKMRKLLAVKQQMPLTVAIDRRLRCSAQDTDALAKRAGWQVVFYDDTVHLDPLLKHLLARETERIATEVGRLSVKELNLPPDRPIIPLEQLAAEHGVGTEAIRALLQARPVASHQLVGRNLVSVDRLRRVDQRIRSLSPLPRDAGWDYTEVHRVLEENGLTPEALRVMGYKVIWKQLVPPRAVVSKR